jgi:hypothetical protein
LLLASLAARWLTFAVNPGSELVVEPDLVGEHSDGVFASPSHPNVSLEPVETCRYVVDDAAILLVVQIVKVQASFVVVAVNVIRPIFFVLGVGQKIAGLVGDCVGVY